MTPIYYTPSPEEFHLGFVFEAKKGSGLINDVHYEEGQEWKETVVQQGDFFHTINPEHVRVKRLDRDDILELEWKPNVFREVASDTQYTFPRDPFRIIGSPIRLNVLNEWIEITSEYSSIYTIFHGILKNKSELKRVMQQVGIIQ